MAEYANGQAALPALLEQLEGAGCIVSIDAMGYQPKIAKQSKEQDGESVLALKGDQGTLYQDVVDLQASPRSTEGADLVHDCHHTVDQQDRDGWNVASLGRLPILRVLPISMPKRHGLGCAALGWSKRNVGLASR